MAAAKIDDFEEVLSCPVCFEQYRNPRTLSCAHQFCLECLEKVFLIKPRGQREITCPTCRCVTPLLKGKAAAYLPRPVLMNEVQELVTKLTVGSIDRAQEKSVIYCDPCGFDKIKASRYCTECRESQCLECHDIHQATRVFAKHRTVIISEQVFCVTHSQMKTLYCDACEVGICSRCTRNEHQHHEISTIQEKADESREQIKEFLKSLDPDRLEILPKDVAVFKESMINSYDNVHSELDEIRSALKKLDDHIIHRQDCLKQKKVAAIESLKLQERQVNDLAKSRDNMRAMAAILMENGSDHELIAKAKEFVTDAVPIPKITTIIKHPAPEIDSDSNTFLSMVERKTSGDLFRDKEVENLKSKNYEDCKWNRKRYRGGAVERVFYDTCPDCQKISSNWMKWGMCWECKEEDYQKATCRDDYDDDYYSSYDYY